MSTGFELIPLAIGGGVWGATKIANMVKKSISEARAGAQASGEAFENARVSFATDMRDLDVGVEALAACGVTPSRESDTRATFELDGFAAYLETKMDDGSLSLGLAAAVADDVAEQFVTDLDAEYRRILQSRSYQRVIEHARTHGFTVSDDSVDTDGTITVTLDV